MKIFLGLTEIAGTFCSLQQGFLKLGYDCTFISCEEHPFQYTDEKRPFVKILHYISKKASKPAKEDFLAKIFWCGLREVLMLLLFVFAVSRYDVFIFIFNSTFLRKQLDLPILKFFKKKTIFLYVGSEARPPYLDGSIMAYDRGKNIQDCIELTYRTKKTIQWVEKYADYIINYPPTGYFHARKFILGLIIGLAKEVKYDDCTEDSAGTNTKIKILHSPSHPEAKGTPGIRTAVMSLKEKGYNIEFIELSGQPNAVVMKHLAQCDFVVDQLYSDTPLAGFATEAAFFGKPAIVGGYYCKQVYQDVPEWCIPPSEYVHPDNIEQAIERLIVDKQYRLTLGEQAKQFADNYLKPENVAARYLRLIHDNVPADWYYDPNRIQYLHGGGLPEKRVQKLIRGVVQQSGVEALQLEDKPTLKKRFLNFAGLE